MTAESVARRDAIYLRLLQAGLNAVCAAAEAGDLARCRAEARLIHNIPSLLGESNMHRHQYFIQQEREMYLDWLAAANQDDYKTFARLLYEPQWRALSQTIEIDCIAPAEDE